MDHGRRHTEGVDWEEREEQGRECLAAIDGNQGGRRSQSRRRLALHVPCAAVLRRGQNVCIGCAAF